MANGYELLAVVAQLEFAVFSRGAIVEARIYYIVYSLILLQYELSYYFITLGISYRLTGISYTYRLTGTNIHLFSII